MYMKNHVICFLAALLSIASAVPLCAAEPATQAAPAQPATSSAPAPSPSPEPQTAKLFSDRMDFADGLYARDMYDMALTEYDGITGTFPSEPGVEAAYFRAAESLFLSKKYDESIARYRAYASQFAEKPNAGAALARVGEALYHSGRAEEAKDHFLGLVGSSNKRAAATADYYLGKIHFEQDQAASAEPYLQRAVTLTEDNPFLPFANFYLGETILARGDPAAAIAFYEKAVSAQAPELKEVAKFGLGRALFLAGRTAEAKVQFEDVYTSPGASGLLEDAFINYLNSLYKLGDFKTLTERASSSAAFVTDAAKLRQARFLTADAYARLGDRRSAKVLYDEIAATPGMPAEAREKALLRRAEATVEEGDYEAAISELNGLIEKENIAKDPLLLLLANVLKRVGRPVEAMSQLDRLMREYPQSTHIAEAMLNKSYILIGLDKPKRARSTLQGFLKQFPGHPLSEKALHDIVLLDIQLSEKTEAIADAETFLTKYPESALAESLGLRLGSLYTDTGDHTAARETFESYLSTYEDTPKADEVYFLLGYNEQAAGRCAEAIGYYNKVDAARVPKETAYSSLKNRAYCEIVQNDFDAAARDYAAVMRDFAENDLKPEAYFWLADYHLKKGDAAAVRLTLSAFASKKEATDHKPEFDYYTAETLRMEGRHAEAVDIYTAAIDAKGLFAPEAYLGRGMAHAALGDAAGAEADFNQALLNSGDDHEVAIRARSELAGILYAKKDFAEAAKAYLAIGILYEDPHSVPEALSKAADAFERAGEPERAQRVYAELVQRFKDDPLAVQASQKLKRE